MPMTPVLRPASLASRRLLAEDRLFSRLRPRWVFLPGVLLVQATGLVRCACVGVVDYQQGCLVAYVREDASLPRRLSGYLAVAVLMAAATFGIPSIAGLVLGPAALAMALLLMLSYAALLLGLIFAAVAWPPRRAGSSVPTVRAAAPGKRVGWHLHTVASPGRNSGRLSAVMRPLLCKADTAAIVLTCNTTNPKNVSVYAHYGFVVIREDRVIGLRLRSWKMRRQPAGATASTSHGATHGDS